MIRLTATQAERIRQHGAEAYPLECCGVLLGMWTGETKTVREVRPLANAFQPDFAFETAVLPSAISGGNVLPGRERRFLVAPDTMYTLLKEERQTGHTVLGFYHSHPDGRAEPSAMDAAAAWPRWTYLIVAVGKAVADQMCAWQWNEEDTGFVSEILEIIPLEVRK